MVSYDVLLHTSPTTPRLWPGPCLVLWAPPQPLQERAHVEVQNVRRPQRLNQDNHIELVLRLFKSWVQVQVPSLHACHIVTTIDRRSLWPRGRHGGVFFCRLSPWLKAIAKLFKGIWVSRLWSCLGLRRSAALVTDSPTCDVFFTRWVLCFCFEEIENWWVLCCSIAG